MKPLPPDDPIAQKIADGTYHIPKRAKRSGLADQMLVRSLLDAIGEDPNREGVEETPARVVKSWRELYAGYHEDPDAHLEKVFAVEHDEMVTLTGITFFSTCEHHMLPFFGTADVSYVPNTDVGVVGLSKLARVVVGYARRLQVQERLTTQVADALVKKLNPRFVGVRVRAQHFCMVARGASQPGASMTTQAVRGELRDDVNTRAEWLRTLPE